MATRSTTTDASSDVICIRVDRPDARARMYRRIAWTRAARVDHHADPDAPVLGGRADILARGQVGIRARRRDLWRLPQAAGTDILPALTPAGGHVDPGGWFNWHATATDIDPVFCPDVVDAVRKCAQESDAQDA